MSENPYNVLCVWPGTTLGWKPAADFEAFILKEFNSRAKFAEIVTTLPDETGPGGRSDLFFWIHNDDIMKFALRRMVYGIRWWEDVLDNAAEFGTSLYPEAILEKYPNLSGCESE